MKVLNSLTNTISIAAILCIGHLCGPMGGRHRQRGPLYVKYCFMITCDTSVLVTPEILTPSRDVRAPFGSNIQLECNVIGHPTPTITWYHANSLIDTVRNVRYVMLQNGNLQIFDVNFADRGLYECIAENSAGDDRIYSTVSVIPLTGY